MVAGTDLDLRQTPVHMQAVAFGSRTLERLIELFSQSDGKLVVTVAQSEKSCVIAVLYCWQLGDGVRVSDLRIVAACVPQELVTFIAKDAVHQVPKAILPKGFAEYLQLHLIT